MPWPEEFEIDHVKRCVRLRDLSDGKDPSSACTASFAKIVNTCIERSLFHTISGQHSELFPILGAKYPVYIERFAAPLFGIIHRGAHLTVYTKTSEGIKIWVPTRSPHSWTYPDMLDTTVAGGVTAKETPFENIIREADEEASFSADLVRSKARPCGIITYMGRTRATEEDDWGLIVPDIVYLFDLEVDETIIPMPKDDEVKEFNLMDVQEVELALKNGEFKTNSAVVMIDFFIRHGILTPENEKDYVEIITRMHRKLPFPTGP